MNVLKHMETIFVVTLAVCGSAAYVADTLPQANAAPVVAANSVATSGKVAVVNVTAKRLNAAQKAVALLGERRGSRA